MGSYFAILNGNKEGMTLNLKTPRGREILWKLARRADILVVSGTDVGNTLYKAMLLWSNPVPQIAGTVMGARFPMIIASRFDSVQTKINTIAMSMLVIRKWREDARTD